MEERNTIVLLRDVQPGEEIYSLMGAVIIHGDILDGAFVSGRDGVSAQNVHNNVTIISKGHILVRNVKNNCNIYGRKGVTAFNILNKGTINSPMGKVSVQNIENNCTINGRDGVKIWHIFGDENNICSFRGPIRAANIIGNNNKLEGRDDINIKVICERSRVTSLMGFINVERVGANSILNGREGVCIGRAYPTASLISSMGNGMVVAPSGFQGRHSSSALARVPGTMFHAASSAQPLPDNEYSIHLNNYIETFKEKVPFTEQLKNLKLSEEEECELKQHLDPISDVVMDIPVSLNENYYDLNTLKKLNKKIDPLTREPFSLRELQSARSKVNEIQSFIEKITNKHTNAITSG